MIMAERRLLLPLAALGLGIVALCAALFLALAPRAPGAPQPSAIGGPFKLVAQDGRVVSDADLKGGPALVFFGYTHCPDVCPTTLFEISALLAKLGPDKKLTGVFVTVDPERDTQSVLKDYLASFDARILGLTGEPAAIDAVKKAYRVYAKRNPQEGGGYLIDHTALVYLLDKQGRFVNAFNLDRPVDEAAKELAGYF